jgi:hypothetical protein
MLRVCRRSHLAMLAWSGAEAMKSTDLTANACAAVIAYDDSRHVFEHLSARARVCARVWVRACVIVRATHGSEVMRDAPATPTDVTSEEALRGIEATNLQDSLIPPPPRTPQTHTHARTPSLPLLCVCACV